MTDNGLTLSLDFFIKSKPFLYARIPEVMEQAAFGLVGEGSECFGLDDEISRDHDWGPAFCLWLSRDGLQSSKKRIESALSQLPGTFKGFSVRMDPQTRMGRVGPLIIEDFYARYTGLNHPPETWQEWRSIPEHALAACTNGEVFQDGTGTFTSFRQALLRYYPEDVRKKKIAARCMIMAQTGQYNFPRSLKRKEPGTAMLAAARFSEAALSMAFLLNHHYMPYYKLACRMATRLPILGKDTAETVNLLATSSFVSEKNTSRVINAVENLCSAVSFRLRQEELTDMKDNWLWDVGSAIQMRISEPQLRCMDVMQD